MLVVVMFLACGLLVALSWRLNGGWSTFLVGIPVTTWPIICFLLGPSTSHLHFGPHVTYYTASQLIIIASCFAAVLTHCRRADVGLVFVCITVVSLILNFWAYSAEKAVPLFGKFEYLWIDTTIL